jgi:uncharacterized damage-inducible protein DinB
MSTTIPTCNAVAAPLAMIFAINNDLMSRALEGLAPHELWHRPTENNNPILWVAGHAVQTRTSVLRMLGEPFDTGWGDVFSRGSALHEQAAYPSREQIQEVAREVNRRLAARLAALDESQLSKPAGGPARPGAKTVADQIGFFALHDSYHVGQLAYIRKGLGYPALVG